MNTTGKFSTTGGGSVLNRSIHAANWHAQQIKEEKVDVSMSGGKVLSHRKSNQKRSSDEAEFQAITTRKNLVTIHSKMDRSMQELDSGIVPIILMNRGGAGGAGGGTGQLSASRPTRGQKTSSFGGADVELQARRMVNLAHGAGGTSSAMSSLLAKLDTDMVIDNTRNADDNIHTVPLRDLICIDDRIDKSKLGADKYMAASEQNREKKKIQEKKKKEVSGGGVSGGTDSDDDRSLSPIETLRVSTPRMRHVRSYRCQTEKEVHDMR